MPLEPKRDGAFALGALHGFKRTRKVHHAKYASDIDASLFLDSPPGTIGDTKWNLLVELTPSIWYEKSSCTTSFRAIVHWTLENASSNF
jgi:hypothetical protein